MVKHWFLKETFRRGVFKSKFILAVALVLLLGAEVFATAADSSPASDPNKCLSAQAQAGEQIRSTPHPFQESDIMQLIERVKSARYVILLLDHDGTFKEHEKDNDAVMPTQAESDLLRDLSDNERLFFSFITGRPMDWMLSRYGNIPAIQIAANHGIVEWDFGNGDAQTLDGVPMDYQEADQALQAFVEKYPLAHIEIKEGRVLHWGQYIVEGEEKLAQVTEDARALHARFVHEFAGRSVDLSKWSETGRYFEILPAGPQVGKAPAANRLLRNLLGENLEMADQAVVIAMGDEMSDNPIFKLVNSIGSGLPQEQRASWLSIKVGEHLLNETDAQHWIDNPALTRNLLSLILTAMRDSQSTP